jgi:hypothetical protein
MLGAALGLAACLVLRVETLDVEIGKTLQTKNPVRFDLGAKVEVRSGQPDNTLPGSSMTQVQVDPAAALTLPFRTWAITLVYEPHLFILAQEYPPVEGDKAAYLHRGRLTLDAHPSPRTRLYANGRFAYGVNDFSPLTTVVTQSGNTGQPPVPPGTTPTAPTPSPGTGRLPDQRFLKVLGFDGSAGLVYSLSPRLDWLVSAGYFSYGGATPEAQTSLPLQKGPKGSTALLWTASRSDNLAFTLDVSNVRFNTGPQSTLANLTTSWTRAWSRSVGTEVVGGVGYFHSVLPASNGSPARTQDDARPVGGLGLRYTTSSRTVVWRNSLSIFAAPSADTISGVINERVSAQLGSVLSPGERLSFAVAGGAAMTVTGTPQRDARGEATISYQVGPALSVAVGARVAWIEGSGRADGLGWLGFVSVAASTGASLFPLPY